MKGVTHQTSNLPIRTHVWCAAVIKVQISCRGQNPFLIRTSTRLFCCCETGHVKTGVFPAVCQTAVTNLIYCLSFVETDYGKLVWNKRREDGKRKSRSPVGNNQINKSAQLLTLPPLPTWLVPASHQLYSFIPLSLRLDTCVSLGMSCQSPGVLPFYRTSVSALRRVEVEADWWLCPSAVSRWWMTLRDHPVLHNISLAAALTLSTSSAVSHMHTRS